MNEYLELRELLEPYSFYGEMHSNFQPKEYLPLSWQQAQFEHQE